MEYFVKIIELILSPHMVWGGIAVFFAYRFKASFSTLIDALSDRVKNVTEYKKTKEGHELLFSGSQAFNENPSLPSVSDSPPEVKIENGTNFVWPEDKTEDIAELRKSAKLERVYAYLWEYRYLNYFLLRHTQMVLDWFISNDADTSMSGYHEYWKKYIVSEKERNDVLSALTNHALLAQKEESVYPTLKGKEYHQWRGPMPPYIIPETNA
jgi:hypothetical protein